MKEELLLLTYTVFKTTSELSDEDAKLVEKARSQTSLAYAPYSNFHVSAIALMENGEMVTGTNQENASYPVAICAERVLLGTVANLFPGMPVKTIALSYNSDLVKCDYPISPCGMCRQALAEYESRLNKPIRLLMTGQTGEVFLINVASQLLPLAFSSLNLNKHT
jgi:cytidine deaminase